MIHTADVLNLPITDISRYCKQESDAYFQRKQADTRYCFELFRRALVEGLERAWEALITQYTPLIQGWIKAHAGFAATGEEAAYFVNRVFVRVRQSVTKERFAKFPDLPALLAYLQTCVNGAILDHLRAEKRHRLQTSIENLTGMSGGDEVEPQIFQAEWQQEFWRLIGRRLKDEQEQQLLYLRYVLDLKPAHICAEYPQQFPDIDKVYVMLQNMTARLKRDPDLRKFFGNPA